MSNKTHSPSKDNSGPKGNHPEAQAVPNLPFGEFVVLAALIMSLVALSTDAILPAFTQLGAELGQTSPQQLQQIITFLFAGLAIGQLFYGPLSDQIGRKPALYFGMALFLIGNLLSWSATDYNQFLLGRFLQGFGVAGPRIVLIALIRDLYAGRAMAQIMSYIMGVFIFVPAIAPIVGQAVAGIAGWRAIFLFVMLLASVAAIWLAVRQKETLAPENRIKVTPANLAHGLRVIFSTPSCVGYTIGAGFVFAPFMLYISTAQNLFQSTYNLGDQFPYYFAGLALSIGLASFLNSRMVMKFGMRRIVRVAIICMVSLALLALVVSYPSGFVPPLPLLMLLFSPLFFCLGLLFGNMNALAMEEVGHVAGLASAVIGSASTLLAMGLATLVGELYDGTIIAMAGFFVVSGTISFLIFSTTERMRERKSQQPAQA